MKKIVSITLTIFIGMFMIGCGKEEVTQYFEDSYFTEITKDPLKLVNEFTEIQKVAINSSGVDKEAVEKTVQFMQKTFLERPEKKKANYDEEVAYYQKAYSQMSSSGKIDTIKLTYNEEDKEKRIEFDILVTYNVARDGSKPLIGKFTVIKKGDNWFVKDME